MCMFHEPEGFWPTIFLHIFLGALESHFPVSRRAKPSQASSVKVCWRYFNFITTFRKYFDPENARIFRKSLPKSEKNAFF